MAVSFSSHSLLTPPRLSASFSFKTLETRTLLTPQSLRYRPHLRNPIIGLPLSGSSPVGNYCFKSPSFKAYLAAEDSAPTNDKEENHQNDVKASEREADGVLSLKNLISTYKAAILHGDEGTVLDIEARIKIIENENSELLQKVSALSAEITSGKEKYIRLQADFDNFRKRSEKEKLTIRSDAQGEVIESLLPMVDSFEIAKQQIKPETEKEKNIDTSYQGIYKQFVEIMRSLQVAAVATVGKPFDPSLHEAIAREESKEYKEGVIIQELRRGFLLGNRLLRPAMVKVSAGPGRKKAPVSNEQPATATGVDDR
ncbi:protein GrpE isoform X2 [Manihot esculenta]|uniref:protein GrpE isoform X2 n=1 Tax=Manihot esculenta TaxID=3983 RepID=UPI000B5D1D87|nr:protein GrpE isoform X2 [Manihot esculenta]